MGARMRTGLGVVVTVVVAALIAGCAAEDRAAVDVDHGDDGLANVAEPDAEQADREEGRASELDADDAEVGGEDVALRLASATPDRVIRDASVELVVEDADEAVSRIGDIAAGADGFVSGADLRRGDPGIPRPPVAEGEGADADRPEPLRGTVTIRVASSELDRVLGELREVAVVERSRSITTRDVSGEYADLQARVRNLRTYEEELLGLLATVRERDDASPDELLNVFERVRDVREEIERIEQRLTDLDDRVSLSTVQIQLSTVTQTMPIGEEPELWRPLEELRAATASLLSTLQTVGTGLIWLGAFVLPVVALFALPAAAIVYGFVRHRRRGSATGSTPAEA